MKSVIFASSNQHKFNEVRLILLPRGISVKQARINLVEIQSDSLEEIAKLKAKSAFALVGNPVMVEDDGLFIHSLNGFPGQYSSFVFSTIGNKGILNLLAGSAHRSASFRSVLAYFDGRKMTITEGRVEGKISDAITEGQGWGYDPVFIPSGTRLTFAELGERKNEYSHRRKALEKFADEMSRS